MCLQHIIIQIQQCVKRHSNKNYCVNTKTFVRHTYKKYALVHCKHYQTAYSCCQHFILHLLTTFLNAVRFYLCRLATSFPIFIVNKISISLYYFSLHSLIYICMYLSKLELATNHTFGMGKQSGSMEHVTFLISKVNFHMLKNALLIS